MACSFCDLRHQLGRWRGKKLEISGPQATRSHLTSLVFFTAMVKYFPIVFYSSVITAIVNGFIWCLFAVINDVM